MFSPANYPWTIVTLCLAGGVVYWKVKVHQDPPEKAASPVAVQTPRNAPTEEDRRNFLEKMAVPFHGGTTGQTEGSAKPENSAPKASKPLRTIVSDGLASLTNRVSNPESSTKTNPLVPTSQDPTLDEFMSRQVDKIFYRKNGLTFSTRKGKSERWPIQLRNLEMTSPMDELITVEDMSRGIDRRVLYVIRLEAWREFKNDTWGQWSNIPPPQMAGFILERKNKTWTVLKSPAQFYSVQ